jgi:hypothetical protein
MSDWILLLTILSAVAGWFGVGLALYAHRRLDRLPPPTLFGEGRSHRWIDDWRALIAALAGRARPRKSVP